MTSQPIYDTNREWDLEDLLDSPRRLGLAQAHARYHGNTTARAALTELAHAITALSAAEPTSDDGKEPA